MVQVAERNEAIIRDAATEIADDDQQNTQGMNVTDESTPNMSEQSSEVKPESKSLLDIYKSVLK